MINPLLKEMPVADIGRRYASTFVRYNGEISFINSIEQTGLGVQLERLTSNGMKISKWNADLLDISRPHPRWVQIGEKQIYYINYLFDRQWHRGFCRNNTRIMDAYGMDVRVDNQPNMLFDLLDAFYSPPSPVVRCLCSDVVEARKKLKLLVLSPQVLIVPMHGSESMVYYREKCLGAFGRIEPHFVQEIKELIGDYQNEDNAQDIQRPKAKVASKGKAGRFARLYGANLNWPGEPVPVPDRDDLLEAIRGFAERGDEEEAAP